jgi:hypothetical protein
MEEWAVEEWKEAQFKEDMMDIDIIRYFGAAYVMESKLSPKEKCTLIDYVKEAEWDQILNLVFNGSAPTRELTVNEQYVLEAQAENFIFPLIAKYMAEGKRKGRKRPTRKEKMVAASMKAKVGAGSASEEEAKKAPKPKAKPKSKKFDPKKFKGTPFETEPAVDPGKPKTTKTKPTSPKEDLGSVYTKTKEYAKSGFKRVKTEVPKHAPIVKRYVKGASVAVLVAAATAAGHRIYKVYLSKAARQCRRLSGPERRSCIVKHRKAGLQAKLQSYSKAKGDCAGSKNPERCRRDLDTKIKKVKYKMGTLYTRY